MFTGIIRTPLRIISISKRPITIFTNNLIPLSGKLVIRKNMLRTELSVLTRFRYIYLQVYAPRVAFYIDAVGGGMVLHVCLCLWVGLDPRTTLAGALAPSLVTLVRQVEGKRPGHRTIQPLSFINFLSITFATQPLHQYLYKAYDTTYKQTYAIGNNSILSR